MKTAIIIHGLPSEEEYFNLEKPLGSNANWLPWLQKQLCARGILAQTPEMPTPYKPDYKAWSELFERFEINENTILVGHSMGGGFLLRWLSEHTEVKVDKVALVAPWLDTEDRLKSTFFGFALDQNLANHCESMTIFNSDNDMERINLTIDLCKRSLKNVNFIELKGRGHFLEKHMGTAKFPELLQQLL